MGTVLNGYVFLPSLLDAVCSMGLFAVFAVVVVRLKRFSGKFTVYLLISGAVLFLFGVLRLFPDLPIYDPGDGIKYLAWGYQITDGFQGRIDFTNVRQIWPGKGFWSLIIGLTGLLLPTPVLLPLMVNIVVLLTVVLILQTNFSYITQSASHNYVLFLALVNPGFLMWGPTLMRENLVWLGVSLVGLAISRRGHGKFLGQVLLATIGFAVVMASRDDFGAVIVAVTASTVLGFPFLTAAIQGRSLRPLRSIHALGTLAFCVLITAAAWWFITRFSTSDDQALLEKVAKKISSRSQLDAATAVPEGSLAERVIGGFLGPFLHSSEISPVYVLVACGTVYFGTLLLLVTLRISREPVQNLSTVASLLTMALILVGVLGLLIGNYGALTRLKTGVGVFLIPHAAASIQEIVIRWRGRPGIRETETPRG